MTNKQQDKRRASSSASKGVSRDTHTSSSGRRQPRRTRFISFRLPVEVVELLRLHVPNLSEFLRCCVYEKLHGRYVSKGKQSYFEVPKLQLTAKTE